MHAINDANAILAFDTPYGNICNIEKVDSNLNTLNVKDIVSRSCQRSQSCKTFYTELSFKIKAFDCTLSNGENTQKVAKMISDACSGKMKNMVDKVQCPENVIGQYQDDFCYPFICNIYIYIYFNFYMFLCVKGGTFSFHNIYSVVLCFFKH